MKNKPSIPRSRMLLSEIKEREVEFDPERIPEDAPLSQFKGEGKLRIVKITDSGEKTVFTIGRDTLGDDLEPEFIAQKLGGGLYVFKFCRPDGTVEFRRQFDFDEEAYPKPGSKSAPADDKLTQVLQVMQSTATENAARMDKANDRLVEIVTAALAKPAPVAAPQADPMEMMQRMAELMGVLKPAAAPAGIDPFAKELLMNMINSQKDAEGKLDTSDLPAPISLGIKLLEKLLDKYPGGLGGPASATTAATVEAASPPHRPPAPVARPPVQPAPRIENQVYGLRDTPSATGGNGHDTVAAPEVVEDMLTAEKIAEIKSNPAYAANLPLIHAMYKAGTDPKEMAKEIIDSTAPIMLDKFEDLLGGQEIVDFLVRFEPALIGGDPALADWIRAVHAAMEDYIESPDDQPVSVQGTGG